MTGHQRTIKIELLRFKYWILKLCTTEIDNKNTFETNVIFEILFIQREVSAIFTIDECRLRYVSSSLKMKIFYKKKNLRNYLSFLSDLEKTQP